MDAKVAKFLKKFALQENYHIYESLFGSIELGQTPPITQSSGAVYGIWLNSDEAPSEAIKEIPDHENWYPVYWGKDISPISRMKAHVQGHKNGNIDLPNLKEVQGKTLIFGAILVSRYTEFEYLLHKRFPPLKGTAASGRRAKVIEIKN